MPKVKNTLRATILNILKTDDSTGVVVFRNVVELMGLELASPKFTTAIDYSEKVIYKGKAGQRLEVESFNATRLCFRLWFREHGRRNTVSWGMNEFKTVESGFEYIYMCADNAREDYAEDIEEQLTELAKEQVFLHELRKQAQLFAAAAYPAKKKVVRVRKSKSTQEGAPNESLC